MIYKILFDCYWDLIYYPTDHTCGEFCLECDNDLEVDFYLFNKFLHHRGLLDYHFIIDDGNKVYEIKRGA